MTDRASEIMRIAAQWDAHGLVLEALSSGESPAKFETRALKRYRQMVAGDGFSIARFVQGFRSDPLHPGSGVELELQREWSGPDYDPRVLKLPWAELSRGLTSGGAAGFLGTTSVLPAVDALRPFSVTARAGVQIVERATGNVTLPAPTVDPEIHWQTDEFVPAIASTPQLSQSSGTPHSAIGLVNFSNLVNRQTNIESFLRRELMRIAGRAIDRAVLAGTGVAGEPIGILNAEGVHAQSGTGYTLAAALAQQTAVAAGGVSAGRWIGAADTRQELAAREVIADTGRFIWDHGGIADWPADVSRDVPDDSLVCGDFSAAVLILWGSGISIDFNPFGSAFPRGGVIARVIVDLDVMIPLPAAFSVAAVVT